LSRYTNAAEILPPELLREVQRHAAGKQLYVPSPATRAPWGQHSGARELLRKRNAEIRRLYHSGSSIRELMGRFYLSYDSVRKIVHGKNTASGFRE